MKKKALALAVAGAFFAPASYAAQDTSGMHYTSAAEGFYASIRAQFSTESKNGAGAGIGNSSSRFGVRGTNDLGNGLKGFYQYEAGVDIHNGGSLSTRVGQVGLEGAFGRVWAGSGWTEGYNMVYGSTDVAKNGSGKLAYGEYGGMRPGRANNMIQYRTPDISGFQGALGVNMEAGDDNKDGYAENTAKLVTNEDDQNVEMWTVAAKYGVQGFTGAFAYSVKPDVDNVDDLTAWTARLGYAQDNWYVNGWYSRDNLSDHGANDDGKYVSIAGGVSVGKVNMYAVWEQADLSAADQNTNALGVQYNLGSRSHVWLEYAGQDLDADPTKAEDYVSVGLRHDF